MGEDAFLGAFTVGQRKQRRKARLMEAGRREEDKKTRKDKESQRDGGDEDGESIKTLMSAPMKETIQNRQVCQGT